LLTRSSSLLGLTAAFIRSKEQAKSYRLAVGLPTNRLRPLTYIRELRPVDLELGPAPFRLSRRRRLSLSATALLERRKDQPSIRQICRKYGSLRQGHVRHVPLFEADLINIGQRIRARKSMLVAITVPLNRHINGD
jgi:hypothetical protein